MHFRINVRHLAGSEANRGNPPVRPRGGRPTRASHRVAGSFSALALLLFSPTGTAAHTLGAEFGDWFRNLTEPGTDGMPNGPTSCCSPAKDCRVTDYDTDADGRYWITTEGERIQVPFEKVLQRTDNPTGRGVACFRFLDGHPIVRCFIRAPEG